MNGEKKESNGMGEGGNPNFLLPSSPLEENAPGASVAQAGHL